MAAVGEAPTLFLRKATGLVKGWSKFDAFLYSFMSVNFVTLGLFFALAVLGYVPAGQVLPAILISGVFITLLVVHPVVLDTDLREHPQRRSPPAAGSDLQMGRPADVARHQERDLRHLHPHGALGGVPRFARDGGVREGSKVLLLPGDGSAGIHHAGDAVRITEWLPECLQRAIGDPVRHLG